MKIIKGMKWREVYYFLNSDSSHLLALQPADVSADELWPSNDVLGWLWIYRSLPKSTLSGSQALDGKPQSLNQTHPEGRRERVKEREREWVCRGGVNGLFLSLSERGMCWKGYKSTRSDCTIRSVWSEENPDSNARHAQTNMHRNKHIKHTHANTVSDWVGA